MIDAVCLSVRLSVYLSVCLSSNLSASIPIYLFMSLSLSVHQVLCVSVSNIQFVSISMYACLSACPLHRSACLLDFVFPSAHVCSSIHLCASFSASLFINFLSICNSIKFRYMDCDFTIRSS